VTDAEGHLTTYTYDDLGRLIETDSPDTGTTRYSYDAAGNLRYKVQNEQQTTEYRYDGLGRLTQIFYADPAENVTLTYDSGSGQNLAGRLASVTDAAGTAEYSYDADGRLVSETRATGGHTFVTAYAYDVAGNLRAITYPTGQVISYQPDATDPARTGAVTLNGTQTLAAGFAYQPYGPLGAMTLGNGIQVAKTYDPNYQLTSIAYGNVMQRTYTTDNVGNITAITDNLDATRSQSFDYDDHYRLTVAAGKYGSIEYDYDKVGNRLSRTHGSVSDLYNYYPGTSRLRTVSGLHTELVEYDDNGNTTRRTPGAGNPAPPISDPNTYTYDSAGRRVKKAGTATTLFHFDQAGQLLAETDTAGNLIKAYVWLDGQPLAMLTPGNAVHYFHNDHLGTPQKLTDSTGAVAWSADYLPFGKADVTVEAVENNLRFSGQYYDEETGLHYNLNRYYDPKIGRYLRADPIGLTGGINLYIYALLSKIN
jgi:RHS repeat-associated protein